MSSIPASSIQSSSIVPVSGPSMEAKGKRLEKKVHELKVKAQLAKGASSPHLAPVKPVAKPSAQTARRNTYEAKKARLESLVQGLAKNARDSQRQSCQQLIGKRAHSEETAEIT